MTSGSYSRYSRHLLLDGFGKQGQDRLSSGRVLIAGAGGLGSPCALYLAAAGVGCIGLADGDIVSLSNLQRQVIHYTTDIGREKVESAAEKMRKLNPEVEVRTYGTFLTEDNALEMVEEYDFIVDGLVRIQVPCKRCLHHGREALLLRGSRQVRRTDHDARPRLCLLQMPVPIPTQGG